MKVAEDFGHGRLLSNVVSGWIAHTIALVVGFVMPRLIHESIGQAALGVWDLGWSLTAYFTAGGIGMAGAITHRIARETGADVAERLRAIITTGFYCQLALAVILGSAVAGLFIVLPSILPSAAGAGAADLQWVGIALGLTVIVGLSGDVAQGVLTGCHRTSWNEYVTLGGDIALALSMVGVLMAGGGIVGLALATLGVRVASELLRFSLAYHACPLVCLDVREWDRLDARNLARFSIKTWLTILPELGIHQGVRVLLAIGAGPAALACYSRYQTVLKQISRFIERPARVILPIASNLVEQGRRSDIDYFRMRASKTTLMASLPMIVVFAVFGDYLIGIWMGAAFVVPGVTPILAMMALLHVDFGVSSRILAGMNAHGRIALFCFFSSLLIFLVLYLALRPLDVIDAAWLAAIATGAGVSVPHYLLSCARLGTPPLEYFRTIYLTGLIANLAFLLGLLYSRELARGGAVEWASVTALASLLLLATLYWRFGLSQNVRTTLVRSLRMRKA